MEDGRQEEQRADDVHQLTENDSAVVASQTLKQVHVCARIQCADFRSRIRAPAKLLMPCSHVHPQTISMMGNLHAYIEQDLFAYIEQKVLQHQLSFTPRPHQSPLLAPYMNSHFHCQLVALDRHGHVTT